MILFYSFLSKLRLDYVTLRLANKWSEFAVKFGSVKVSKFPYFFIHFLIYFIVGFKRSILQLTLFLVFI